MRMSIDPINGGCTIVQDGHPASILCAGYIGSTILGGLFVLGGFDTLAAKILSFVAGVGLIAPLSLVRDKLYVSVVLVTVDRLTRAQNDFAYSSLRRLIGRVLVYRSRVRTVFFW
jgi:hypothetical protein